MPRIPPRQHPSTRAQKATAPSKKDVISRTRDGRITKPYKVSKRSSLKEILRHDARINRANGWIKNAASKLKEAGDGAYADRPFQKDELIGRFRGKPVYELEMDGKTVCIFTMESGRVRFLTNISQVIWSGQTTKQLETKPEATKKARTLYLNFGIQVEDRMSKINYHKTKDNVVARIFYDEQFARGTLADGRILIDPKADFHTCLAIALHAKKDLKEGSEMYLNYMPDAESELDFAAMDHLPEPSLTPEEQIALQIAVDNIEPKHEVLDIEQNESKEAETDSDSVISMETPPDFFDDLTPTPSELGEPQITGNKAPEPSPAKKPARWFGRCNIQ